MELRIRTSTFQLRFRRLSNFPHNIFTKRKDGFFFSSWFPLVSFAGRIVARNRKFVPSARSNCFPARYTVTARNGGSCLHCPNEKLGKSSVQMTRERTQTNFQAAIVFVYAFREVGCSEVCAKYNNKVRNLF